MEKVISPRKNTNSRTSIALNDTGTAHYNPKEGSAKLKEEYHLLKKLYNFESYFLNYKHNKRIIEALNVNTKNMKNYVGTLDESEWLEMAMIRLGALSDH